jgi:hypothetical protein
MRNPKLVTLALSATALVGALIAAPAAQATTATFTLSGAGLSVSQPTASATLTGSALALAGTSMTGQLGSTTVLDERGALLGGFTVKMSSTAFTRTSTAVAGTTPPAEDTYAIPATAVTGYSGVVTPEGVIVPVGTTAVTPAELSTTGGGTIVTVTGVTGTASITYNPTVSVAVPGAAPAGTYTGTVTQTAS